MESARIIKKYPNRRLYDTAISRYITLEEIQTLVLKSVPFKVIDARTKADMTHYVLLQIITERENGHSPIFSTDTLQNIIRFYGHPLQHEVTDLFEKNLAVVVNKKFDIESVIVEDMHNE